MLQASYDIVFWTQGLMLPSTPPWEPPYCRAILPWPHESLLLDNEFARAFMMLPFGDFPTLSAIPSPLIQRLKIEPSHRPGEVHASW